MNNTSEIFHIFESSDSQNFMPPLGLSGVEGDPVAVQMSAPPEFGWTRLLGTSEEDSATALTTGSDGSIYVAGYTYGDLGGQTNSGLYDAFITRFQPDGTKAWTRLLGTSSWDSANALTTGRDGSIYVAGYTEGDLDGQTNSGGGDAFISKLIVDEDEDLPQITIADTRLKEGDSGQTNARFVVRLDSPSSEIVTVRYATANGTATAGEDYRQTTGRLIFQPGQTRQFINVPVFGDTNIEPDETFMVNLRRPQNAELARAQATGTIINDDFPQITIADTEIIEGDSDRTNARFVVRLDNPSSERVVVNYATADGTATAGEDYRPMTGRVVFSPGQTSQVINVPVLGDTKVEPDETFRVNLSRPQNATLGRRQAIGTILNDDFPGDNNQQPEPPDDRFSSAENLGRLTGEIVRTDRIGFASGGDRNTEDYYRFHLNREGTVQVVLDDLFQNANLQFLGSTGDIINQSRNPGTDPEIITQRKLEPGTYYVRVFPHLGARTPYRLSIDLI